MSTADLYDEHGEALASIDLQFRSFGLAEFEGPVRTLRCFQDNALVKQLLNQPGNGAVLVVDGGASVHTALMGDLIAAAAVRNGWTGVVIVGAIRDASVIDTLPIGVKALGTNPRKSAKDGVGAVDVEIVVDGVPVSPGMHLWSDQDGILVGSPLTE